MYFNFPYNNKLFIKVALVTFFLCISCSENRKSNDNTSDSSNQSINNNEVYANIDFSNWKVTLPIDKDNNGKPDEYKPDELINFGYQTNEEIKPFMYDDTDDSSIVFYTYPESSTTNSSYSRTELRELINPNNSKENWTLAEGGEMKGKLKIKGISEDTQSSYNYHKVIVMQIHGIISEEDVSTHNFSGNNGPPLIKIYWKDGFIWCHKKSLVDETTDGDDLIQPYTSSNNFWTDIKDNLGYVGYESFDFRITASDAKIEVQLNNNTPVVYQDVSLNKWHYQNYFKAGNYLNTTNTNAYSYIKYYSLYITH